MSPDRHGWIVPENGARRGAGGQERLRSLPSAEGYLFDIDGTLLNSRDGVHYNAFRRAVAEVYGIDTKLDNVPVHGNTDLGIIRAILEKAGRPDDLEGGLPRVISIMRAEVENNVAGINPELCPSIRELVERLHAEGKVLGVASGNLESIGWAKITAAGLRRFFSVGSFSDERELRSEIFRHGIDQARKLLRDRRAVVCIIGDTPADIRAARDNHAPVVAVSTGIYSYEELECHQPDLCLHCCSDLFVKGIA